MNPKRFEISAISLAVTVCLAGSLPGCIPCRTACAVRPDPMVSPQRHEPVQSVDAKEQDVLAAVEEFLERTDDYQFPGPSSSPSEPVAFTGTRGGSGTVAPPARVATPTAGVDQAFANAQVTLGGSVPAVLALALPVVRLVSIRSTEPVEVPIDRTAKTRTTNEGLDMGSTEPRMLVDRLISHLEARASDTRDVDGEWQLRLTQLALHRDDEAADVSVALPQGARRILASLIRLAVAVRRVAQNPLDTGAEALTRVDELRETLADRADPGISTVALCRKVVTFGVYEEMAAAAFVAGRTTRTIVYSEIRNLRFEAAADDRYRTRLRTRLEVLTTDGRSVWQHEEPEIVDLCRRRRTDFFIAQRITLPATLPAGDYVVKLLVEDKVSGRATEASHPLTLQSALTAGSYAAGS